MEADDPEAQLIADAGFRSVVLPLHADHVATIRPTLLLLQTGALLLLLIGAVNVANLLLIRASSRGRELAIRQAIGASPRHVVSLVLVESAPLTFIGGILGVAIGAAGMRLLNVLGAARLPLGSHIVFDAPLALVALAAAIVLGIAIGAVYYPYSDRFDSAVYLVSRSSLSPETLRGTLQQVVRAIDPELPVNNVTPMETRIADSLVARRSPALLAILFSGIAILLTAIGTYGVLSYAVAQRRREIGLRMALGARPEQVRAQFVALAMRLLAGGVIVGVISAWATGRAMQTVLFHVPALHVAILSGTALIMATVSLAACLLPSHRAACISPMEALADT
jgi:ABC-type antimicrobial peptide transport system permease subunit